VVRRTLIGAAGSIHCLSSPLRFMAASFMTLVIINQVFRIGLDETVILKHGMSNIILQADFVSALIFLYYYYCVAS